jgi:hypothetical protein
MRKLSDPSWDVRPSNVFAYTDRVIVWLKEPLSNSQLRRMRPQCDHLRVDSSRNLYPEYKQQLVITRPRPDLLALLAARTDARVTYLEIALDWIFDDEDQKQRASTFLRDHILKPYQRGQLRVVNKTADQLGTLYSGSRRTVNNLVNYDDKPCRITGEVDCVHTEWRLREVALRRIGIWSIDDVLRIDLRRFWADRLRLFTVDPNKLGLRYNNWEKGTRRKRPWIERFGRGRIEYHRDLRMGHQLLRHWRTVSEIMRIYRPHFDVRACLNPINIENLLPRNSGAPYQ